MALSMHDVDHEHVLPSLLGLILILATTLYRQQGNRSNTQRGMFVSERVAVSPLSLKGPAVYHLERSEKALSRFQQFFARGFSQNRQSIFVTGSATRNYVWQACIGLD